MTFTEIELDLSKNARENAAEYYEKAKKAKAKLSGLLKAVGQTKALIEKEKREKAAEKEKPVLKAKRKRAWFEKFHWFITSKGKLVIGGRDAKTNEVVVKKHLEERDYYCHADIVGAPHVVIKDGQKAEEAELLEAAVFAASYSKAWKSGATACDVFFANQSQVSKKAEAGEFLSQGAFMVRGERKWLKGVKMQLALGLIEHEGMKLLECGPESAVKAKGTILFTIRPGSDTKNEAAKKAFAKTKTENPEFTLDDVISILPNGGMKLGI